MSLHFKGNIFIFVEQLQAMFFIPAGGFSSVKLEYKSFLLKGGKKNKCTFNQKKKERNGPNGTFSMAA